MTERQEIYEKYDEHCAFCGEKIPYLSDMMRSSENLPMCPPCWRHRHNRNLETWRFELQQQVERLRTNYQFCRAVRYGQVEITESPIVFHFEKRETNTTMLEDIQSSRPDYNQSSRPDYKG